MKYVSNNNNNNNNNIIVTASKQTNLKENSGLPQSKCLFQVRDVSSFKKEQYMFKNVP